MDAYNDAFECESELLSMLSEAEELSVKKARIYSRLLTDAALAEDMEALALRHERRKGRARQACGGKEMKNSKREITLNEYDSLEDMLFMEKSLMREYCTAIFSARRKETRVYLVEAFSSVAGGRGFSSRICLPLARTKRKKTEKTVYFFLAL